MTQAWPMSCQGLSAETIMGKVLPLEGRGGAARVPPVPSRSGGWEAVPVSLRPFGLGAGRRRPEACRGLRRVCHTRAGRQSQAPAAARLQPACLRRGSCPRRPDGETEAGRERRPGHAQAFLTGVTRFPQLRTFPVALVRLWSVSTPSAEPLEVRASRGACLRNRRALRGIRTPPPHVRGSYCHLPVLGGVRTRGLSCDSGSVLSREDGGAQMCGKFLLP